MNGPARKISFIVVGCHGLDVLSLMRLKVASSLLMAEYIQADVQQWSRQKVDLLVVSIDDDYGHQLMRDAAARKQPLLAVTRSTGEGSPVPVVACDASVREIFDQLRQLMLSAESLDEILPPANFFHSLAAANGKSCLIGKGPITLRFDADRRQVELASGTAYERCLKEATVSGWTLLPLASTGSAASRMAEVASRHAFEDFCWRSAILSAAPLVPVNMQRPAQLRGWPEVAVGQLPLNWLLPMAALMIRPWRPESLAQATRTSFDDIARIIAAASTTELLDSSVYESPSAVPRSRGRSGKISGFLSRSARRFGLTFPKALQV